MMILENSVLLPVPLNEENSLTRITGTIVINSTAAHLYNFITTPQNLPHWLPSSLSVQGEITHSLKVGERFTEQYQTGDYASEIMWSVIESKASNRWAIRGRIRGNSAGIIIIFSLYPTGRGTLLKRELLFVLSESNSTATTRLFNRRRLEIESEYALCRLKEILEA